MKLTTFATSVALCIALAPAAANAQFAPSGTYVGLDYQYVGLSYEDQTIPTTPPTTINGSDVFSDTLHGVNLHVGTRFVPSFGAEGGFIWTAEGEKNIFGVATTKVHLIGGTLSALGYFPIVPEQNVELVGLVGGTYLQMNAELSSASFGTISDDTSEWGFRAGGGIQVQISDALFIRFLGLYQSADFEDTASGAFVGSVGINFLLP